MILILNQNNGQSANASLVLASVLEVRVALNEDKQPTLYVRHQLKGEGSPLVDKFTLHQSAELLSDTGVRLAWYSAKEVLEQFQEKAQ